MDTLRKWSFLHFSLRMPGRIRWAAPSACLGKKLLPVSIIARGHMGDISEDGRIN
jgi:hypothetical protein